MQTLSALFGLLTFGLHFLVPVLGLILIAVKGRGTARKLGVAGCALIAGIALLQGSWILVAPQLIESFGSLSTVTVYSAVNAAFSVASAVGIALVIAAVIADRSGAQSYAPSNTPGPPR